VTQSTHKVASALSQGSLLLINKEPFIELLYEHVNDLGFVSTSFSYPILASLELGIRQLAEDGDRMWSLAVSLAQDLRAACRGLAGIKSFGDEKSGAPGFRHFDPTRVTIDVSDTGMTGFEFLARLNRHRIYPEMATLQHVLFLLTPGTTKDDVYRLSRELERVVAEGGHRATVVAPAPPPLPRMAVIPRVAKFAPKRAVYLRDAVGKVSGETVATYPPGAPVIAAGEVIAWETVEYLRCLKRNGAVLRGASDSSLETMKVLS
jgi:arginine/lysine/ornithine decarboxylase